MALKVFDYACQEPDCKYCGDRIERFVNSSNEDFQKCQGCRMPMDKEIPAPKGYVRGTTNPVRV